MFEAKTNLSDLVKKAQAGKTVIVTSGRDKNPVAKIDAIEPVNKKRIGLTETPNFVLTGSLLGTASRRVGRRG